MPRRHQGTGGGVTGISLVAAMDRERAIGIDNGLPWHLPDDLKRFKAMTTGKTVLMGRRTAESLGRALPNRINLVLTRSGRVPFDGMQAVASLEQAMQVCGVYCHRNACCWRTASVRVPFQCLPADQSFSLTLAPLRPST